MILAPLTPREARLLLDHLDHEHAANLPEREYARYWSAKQKLLDIEMFAGRETISIGIDDAA